MMLLQVGDIVRVDRNQQFPCDLVLLSSSNSTGKCFVMTANLDGETSLKTRVSAPLTRELRTEAQAGGMFGCIGGSWY